MQITERYSLKELADRTGVSARTIRYYTEQGLLPPPAARGRYAVYTNIHVDRLREIVRLKEAFLPLSTIRERLSGLPDEQTTLPDPPAGPRG